MLRWNRRCLHEFCKIFIITHQKRRIACWL